MSRLYVVKIFAEYSCSRATTTEWHSQQKLAMSFCDEMGIKWERGSRSRIEKQSGDSSSTDRTGKWRKNVSHAVSISFMILSTTWTFVSSDGYSLLIDRFRIQPVRSPGDIAYCCYPRFRRMNWLYAISRVHTRFVFETFGQKYYSVWYSRKGWCVNKVCIVVHRPFQIVYSVTTSMKENFLFFK